ncbi:hypothetical protein [Castellaniella sp.]|nr:hypothetical protein [Castellaniella sp.]
MAKQHQGVTLTLRTPEVTPEVVKVIAALKADASRQELQLALGLKDSI